MDEMAKHKNRHDLMENEEVFLDDPEAELAEDEAEPAPEAVAEDEAAALRAEVADLKDRLLRALADVENIRKRAERDRRDAEIYGAHPPRARPPVGARQLRPCARQRHRRRCAARRRG